MTSSSSPSAASSPTKKPRLSSSSSSSSSKGGLSAEFSDEFGKIGERTKEIFVKTANKYVEALADELAKTKSYRSETFEERKRIARELLKREKVVMKTRKNKDTVDVYFVDLLVDGVVVRSVKSLRTYYVPEPVDSNDV